MNQSDSKIAVFVFYNAFVPFAKLTLPATDGYLYWLQDTLDLQPLGKDFCLRIRNDRELRVLKRFFPEIKQCSRHLRFRAYLRRKATRKAQVTIVKTRQVFVSQPFEPTRMASFSGFRVKWISSLLKLSLTFF